VFQNLLDNAVKYGRPDSEVVIGVEPVDRVPGTARPGLAVRVTDQGEGIPQADLSRLTERFYRVDKARSRALGGTGLGLAIVKHIVGRHRGRLTIDSEEDVGSTFTVVLPVYRP
jgi:two-component system phosphate regulon sensor histidine kinase PhoR